MSNEPNASQFHKSIDGLETRSIQSQSGDFQSDKIVDHVAQEAPVAISYNGNSHAVMMVSPVDLADFAFGFSLTERIVDSVEQIRHVELNTIDMPNANGTETTKKRSGYALDIRIDAHLIERLDQQRRQISGRSGCGVCGISELTSALPNLAPLTAQQKPAHSVIDAALKHFNTHLTMQAISGATHAAALYSHNAELIVLREDIGRHNALDKLIGALLQAPRANDPTGDFIVMSSRASHELVNKTVIAGVTSLVCISAATTLAIDLAEQLKLNLIGFIRKQRQLIYYQNQL